MGRVSLLGETQDRSQTRSTTIQEPCRCRDRNGRNERHCPRASQLLESVFGGARRIAFPNGFPPSGSPCHLQLVAGFNLLAGELGVGPKDFVIVTASLTVDYLRPVPAPGSYAAVLIPPPGITKDTLLQGKEFALECAIFHLHDWVAWKDGKTGMPKPLIRARARAVNIRYRGNGAEKSRM